SIVQANNASNNCSSTCNLLQLTNSDTSSTNALISLSQAGTNATFIDMGGVASGQFGISYTSVSGTGITFSTVDVGKGIDFSASQAVVSGSQISMTGSGTNHQAFSG